MLLVVRILYGLLGVVLAWYHAHWICAYLSELWVRLVHLLVRVCLLVRHALLVGMFGCLIIAHMTLVSLVL